MRKFLVVGLLALPLVALTGSPAQAWCKFGFSINLQSGGCKWCIDGGQPPAQNTCCQTTPVCGCCPAPVGFVPLPGAKPAAAAAAPAAVQPANYWQAGYYQPAGYNVTGFGNYQVPSYWYGN